MRRGKVRAYVCDVMNRQQVHDMARAVAEEWGTPVVPSVGFSPGRIKDVHDRWCGLNPGKTNRLRLRYELVAGPDAAGGQSKLLPCQEAAEFPETREQFRAAMQRRQRPVEPGANACGAVPRAVIQDFPESRRVDERLGVLKLDSPSR